MFASTRGSQTAAPFAARKGMEPSNIEKMVVLARQRWGTYSFKSCSHTVDSAFWLVTEGMRAMIFYPAFETSQPRQVATAHAHPVDNIGLD